MKSYYQLPVCRTWLNAALLVFVNVFHIAAQTNLTSNGLRPIRSSADVDSRYADGALKWTPETSVAIRYFYKKLRGGPKWDISGDGDYAVEPSPNGKYFFFANNVGNIPGDMRVAEIFVYSVRDVLDALSSGAVMRPRPIRSLKIEAPRVPLSDVQWAKGKEAVINYLAAIPGKPEIFGVSELDILTGKTRLMTDIPAGHQIQAWTYYSKGNNSIFTTGEDTFPTDPSVEPITPGRAKDFLYNARTSDMTRIYRTYVQTPGRKPWQLTTGWVASVGLPVWFSPDARYAVMIRKPVKVPQSWSQYDRKNQERSGVPKELNEFILIDIANHNEKSILNAPMGAATVAGIETIPANLFYPWKPREHPQVMWSSDSRSAVIVNTALPLVGSDDQGRATMAYIVSYDVGTGKHEVLETVKQSSGLKFKDISWVKEGRELLVRHQTEDGRPAAGTIYSHSNGKWQPKPADASFSIPEEVGQRSLPGGLKVELRETANDPPAIVASLNGKDLDLSGPDPALNSVWFARMEPFKWKDGAGKEQTGGIMLPRDLPADGAKIPLVIQNYNYEPHLFHPDGPFSTAYAAQAMVAQGMAVISIGVPRSGGQNSLTATMRDWVDTLSVEAAKIYPIDLNRVGAVGFSQAGIQLRSIVTDPGKLRLAAVVAADSFSYSYSSYLQSAAAEDSDTYERLYGGAFFTNKQEWFDRELTFNADRVMTPVLFSDNNINLAHVLATVGAYKLAKRPFDYLTNRERAHALCGVSTRQASLEATVDWMNFWLQGRETPRSYDPDRYIRWRAARELHKANLAEEAKNGGPKPRTTPSDASTTKSRIEFERREVAKKHAREEMQRDAVADPGGDPLVLNAMAYKAMYEEKDAQKALKYLSWNLALFTGTRFDADLNDSLAEGFLIAGDVAKTIEHYEAALKFNPWLPGQAKKIVERLKADPGTLAAIQDEMAKAYQAFVASQQKKTQ